MGILQINFRGSTGHGRAFWEAGFKQWSGKIQQRAGIPQVFLL